MHRGDGRATKFMPRWDGKYWIIAAYPEPSSYRLDLNVQNKRFVTFHASRFNISCQTIATSSPHGTMQGHPRLSLTRAFKNVLSIAFSISGGGAEGVNTWCGVLTMGLRTLNGCHAGRRRVANPRQMVRRTWTTLNIIFSNLSFSCALSKPELQFYLQLLSCLYSLPFYHFS